MPIDLTKPVQTRRGGKVTIFATDISGPQSIAGKEEFAGTSYLLQWDSSGSFLFHGPSILDLINVPEKRTLDVWVNVYGDKKHTSNASNEEADKWAICDRIACVHIVQEYTVGEWL